MTRTLTLYVGADMDPSYDYSDWVEWPDCEFGIRSHNGEATQSDLRVRDVLGETGEDSDLPVGLTFHRMSAHNVFTLTEDASGADKHIFRGWVIPKDYSRGTRKADRAREIRVSLEDYNTELRGIIVGRDAVESRPAETDVERVLWLLGAYLDGDPREATVIGDAYVAATNTVTMPAKEYSDATPDDVLRDCAVMAGKVYWVVLNDDGTLDLFYDTIDSAAYASTLQIRQTGDPTEVDGETTFEPIWDVGPASREDGQQLLCGVKLVGPGDISAYIHHDVTHGDYNHYEEVVYDDSVVTQAEATAKAAQVLAVRRFEWRTYSCSIFVPADRIHLIRPGMNITIQAKVIPDADDQVVTRRIAQMKFKVQNNDLYKVMLQLDRPIRQPFGKGTKPGPVPVGDTTCTDVTASLAPSAFDGEAALTGPWYQGGVDVNPITNGTQHGGSGYYHFHSLANPWAGYTFSGTWNAGTTYTVGFWTRLDAGAVPMVITLGQASGARATFTADKVTLTVSSAEPDWTYHEMVWTPASTISSSGVYNGTDDVKFDMQCAAHSSDGMDFDDGSVCVATPGVSIGGPGEGTAGGDGYVGGGTVIEHGDQSGKGGTMHDASQIEFDPTGLANTSADDVQAAIEDLDGAIAAGGAPTTVDYLVGTASAGLSAEIVVGTTPGGELGGTWASPTVDATHSGSAHHAENHNTRHASGGADAVKLDDLAAPDDNTDLNASTSAHGLLRKLSGTSTEYLDGSGAWSTPAGGGGGGGLTQAYVGYNSIGATQEQVTRSRIFLKKITLANACLLTSVEIYIKQVGAAQAFGVTGFVYDDSSGEPLHLLSYSGAQNAQPTLNPYRASGVAGDARWFNCPQGIWLTAGDYWIGGAVNAQNQCYFYYDGTGGTDCWWDMGGNAFVTDAPDTSGTVYTRNDTTRQYSFRANTIR